MNETVLILEEMNQHGQHLEDFLAFAQTAGYPVQLCLHLSLLLFPLLSILNHDEFVEGFDPAMKLIYLEWLQLVYFLDLFI